MNQPTKPSFSRWLATLAFLASLTAQGQIQMVPDKQPQQVFSGEARKICVIFRNNSEDAAETVLRARMYQASSATAVRLREFARKKLSVLPGQTVLERASIDLPDVNAPTLFLLQWIDAQERVLGWTELLVYPEYLLKEINPLIGEYPLGVFDPQNRLKPLLEHSSVSFVDLADAGFECFTGKLAIIDSSDPFTGVDVNMRNKILLLVKRNAAVIWIQPPGRQKEIITPSFYTVQEHGGAIVILQASMVSDLARNPKSQLNLIALSRLALNPKPLLLPNFAMHH
jgi:hypothetical protein